MTLTWPVVAAVLFGALLHASWNALIKRGTDKALDTALIHVLGVLIALPIIATTGFPRVEAFPYLIASLVIHIAYYIALVGAYKHGELALTYPIMRGSAPLLVALASTSFIGEALQPLAWLGVIGISAGVAAVGLSRSAVASAAHGHHTGTALRYAFANAAIIALYTIVDGRGVRASGDALAYVATLFLFDGVPYFLIVMWQRRAVLNDTFATMRRRWPVAIVGSAASLGSYGIALWAMTKAPVATVAALRETAVLFAAVIGAVWLKEGFGAQRAFGTVLIVAGVMTLRLA